VTITRVARLAALLTLLLALAPSGAAAQGSDPARAGESIRRDLAEAQLLLARDPAAALRLTTAARAAYEEQLAAGLRGSAPGAHSRATRGFRAAAAAIERRDAPSFAAARSRVWTALLEGSRLVVERAIQSGDAATARLWLPLREYRAATRFSRPDTDATLALRALADHTLPPPEVLQAVRADLLDTYQARMAGALHDLADAEKQGFRARQAELGALAEGYFGILAPAYREQRGGPGLSRVRALFADLARTAAAGGDTGPLRAQIAAALRGFRAAPLSGEERARRAGQLTRFLSLVPVEYERGVRDGKVTVDLEIREAITFRDGAAAAFADLEPLLDARDRAATATVAELLGTLEAQLADAGAHREAPSPDAVRTTTERTLALLRDVMPPEWQKRDAKGDFDVIGSMLDQMEEAAAQGQWAQAESARLEAYAVLESGPEARLVVFAPQLKAPIEDLFWYGQGEHKGLARLIRERAPAGEIRASRAALDVQLEAAGKALSVSSAPVAVATNAAVIVFREGLEAVLILASLMGSLKRGAQRRYRRPLWVGAGAAFLASVLTFVLARGLLMTLARYGERLEAVVSLVAIAVLLLITNWFFHKVYWTGWMANFHSRKKRILAGREVGQWLGLGILGFTSIYREGFETVLFLQALVLDGGAPVVLGGVALGLAATALVGVLVFALQAKLPHKKMLIVTGVMIGAVLLVMVGNTVHVLQVVGWMPIHPIHALISLPYWTGLWLGLYATWEGIALQVVAGVFVIGSYVLAERAQDGRARSARHRADATARGEAGRDVEGAPLPY
jgi:high-affinity iron transporter